MRKCSNLPKNTIMEGIMCKLDEIMKKRETVYSLARKYNVLRIFVFGSCARKEETPESDIDFLAEFNDNASLFDQIGMQQALSDMLKCKVDVIPSTSLSDPDFGAGVQKDMVAL